MTTIRGAVESQHFIATNSGKNLNNCWKGTAVYIVALALGLICLFYSHLKTQDKVFLFVSVTSSLDSCYACGENNSAFWWHFRHVQILFFFFLSLNQNSQRLLFKYSSANVSFMWEADWWLRLCVLICRLIHGYWLIIKICLSLAIYPDTEEATAATGNVYMLITFNF